MGRLVIMLDRPILYGILEENQLLMMEELPPENVTAIIDKVGDYPITEVAAYMKFDTRQDIEGVEIDRIITDSVHFIFKMAQSDYDFLKALALRFGAKTLSIYSAYKHYASIINDGIIVDGYIDHNYVVAGLQDGRYRSLNICAAERLQRTIDSCKLADVTYAAAGVIPTLGNIEEVPTELHETLFFLQFLMTGQPSYQVDIDSGEVFEYGDQEEEKVEHVLEAEDEEVAAAIVAKNLGPKKIAKKPKITANSIFMTALCVIFGIISGGCLVGYMDLDPGSELLDSKISYQFNQIERQTFEQRFLENGITDETAGLFYTEYKGVQSVIGNNGAIVSIRFRLNKIELTMFVLDEAMKDRAVTSLSGNYQVDSCDFEKLVDGGPQGQAYLQYNVVLDILIGH